MTKIFISGAGAFGVALALSLEKTQKNITAKLLFLKM